jgi:MFS family permease
MEYILRSIHRAGIFGWLYIMSLLFGFHFFGIHYINSSFLGQFVSQTDIGVMYAISSMLTMCTLGIASLVLSKIGNYQTALIATAFNFCAMLGLSFVENVGWVFVLFAIHIAVAPVTLFAFDVFLEANTKDENTTGRIRTIFLSMGLIASLFAPALSGVIAGDSAEYTRVYFASALFLLPVFAVLVLRFQDFQDPRYEVLSVPRMLSALWKNNDLFHVSGAQFLMRFLFSWYVVYLPIYLHETAGFSWPEIGLILFIMLVPYVLIEYPAGRLADKVLGEKELMVTGFIITALSTGALFFIEGQGIWVWSAILFMTRVGTALIESMTETYFFKQIDGDDTSILSIFRMLRPLAYAIGPLTAGALIAFMNIGYLWLILAVIMLVGIIHPLSLNDTK